MSLLQIIVFFGVLPLLPSLAYMLWFVTRDELRREDDRWAEELAWKLKNR